MNENIDTSWFFDAHKWASPISKRSPSSGDGHDHKTQSAESEMVLARMRDDNEIESKSGSGNLGGASGDDNDLDRQPKRKRYHRHTPHQIQEMEAFFKDCPHPDDKQRKELSRELGLEPLQVKFWFQNKRTQMKTHSERQENGQLRAENERLRADNMRYREAIGSGSCPTCGGPTALVEMSFDDQHLMIENARLREEIDRITGVAANHVGKPLLSYPPLLSPSVSRSSLDLGIGNFSVQPGVGGDIFGDGGELLNKPHISGAPLEIEKPMVIERAVSAMEELLIMAQLGEPLWVPGVGVGGPSEVLSEEEYLRCFPRGFGPRPFGFKSEASRETVVVMMNPSNLVEILMDVHQSSSMFFNIISRGVTLEILSTGVGGNWNGALQVMSVEFQLPTPLVPTRESYFVRYCKRHHDGSWAVADVSLDNVPPSVQPVLRCRRRPSGCVIQEMPNGYSKVTWVEHLEVDDREVHTIYRSLVNSGLAFGAKRWVSTLGRQCERLASAMVISIIPRDAGGGKVVCGLQDFHDIRAKMEIQPRSFVKKLLKIKIVITSLEGRQSMLKLAERMMISFCAGVSSSTAHTWTTLSGSGAEEVRVMTRKSVGDPGRPPGIVLSAATSFRLPVPPKRVFDFLRDENSRNEWDILSNGAVVQETAHIANGHEPGNCVSLLRVDSPNSNQSKMLILQESCTDSSGSYVIYAPVDVVAMDSVLAGRDPDTVALLPSGFAILPDGATNQYCGHVGTSSGGAGGGTGAGAGGGSLLTVGFQILVDSAPTAKLSLASVATVNNLIACTVHRIKVSVISENA